MINDYLFSAIYNDGKVTINDKEFEAGYFTVQIMNHQILKDDISKLSDAFFNNSLLLRSLSEKEIDRNLFISACNEYDAFLIQ